MTDNELSVAGFVPFSTVDWPGKLAASVFCQGCPWQCPYCHNHEIIDPKKPGTVPWREVMRLLKRRAGLLDGVVFSGGEALMQAGVSRAGAADGVEGSPLGRALAEVRAHGFATGLHAAGAYPARLRALLEAGLLDWVGLDIKAVPGDYGFITGSPISAQRAEASLAALVAHPEVSHEVRLTLWPGILTANPNGAGAGPSLIDYGLEVAKWAHARGAKRFALQRFQEQGAPDLAVTIAREATGGKGSQSGTALQNNASQVAWDDAEARFLLQQIGFESIQVR